ncbi:TonB-dependent receptor [Marinifilum caeruleilacunae]|uniref:TonB-dependent receptor n=1 Tax=Marinifilum caeruleilacunae TaxID=2499076 RepID=A0ABX1WQT6_9BACT|nr:TonB-dependent receptor [Marinifilum caeruleilacunae]NOU58340.1 TonB-dependent receptor [Marinifilum caeruleilacunae]
MQGKLKALFLFVAILGVHTTIKAQNSQIQFLQKNNKPLTYANVSWQVMNQPKWIGYAASDENGFINIPVNPDKNIIVNATCVGYKSVIDTIVPANTKIIIVEEDVLNLEQVTITGTRTPHTLKNAPVLTQMITEQDIEAVDTETLTDVLEVEMPGMEMARHGGTPVMNVMGLESQYSLVLIDGARMAKGLHKSVDYTRINTANIERIEIVRGASSALYGSSAMGGVINVVTKKPSKKLNVAVDLRFQQRNQKNHSQRDLDNADDDYARDFFKNIDKPNLNGNLSLGYKRENFFSNTFFNYKSSDAYKLTNTEGVKRYYQDIDKVVIEEVSGGTEIYGYSDFTINQEFGYKLDRWDFNLGGSYFRHNEFDFTNDAVHELYKSHSLKAKAKRTIHDNSFISFTHNYDDYLRFDYGEISDTKTKTHDNAYHTSKLTYTNKLGKHNLLAEVEHVYQALETDKFITDVMSSKSTNNSVLVLQDQFKLNDATSLVLGLRTGYHTTFDFHTSPSATIKQSLGPFNVRLSYARGFRSPDLKELYMNWSHLGMFQIIGNTDLKPETNDYYAFSLDFINGARNLNATLITSFNKVHDKIDGIWTNNETEYRYVNFDDAEIFTVEGLLKWKFHQNFKLKAGYIYQKSVKSTDAQDLSSMSPMALTGQLEYKITKGKYRLIANLSGKVTGKKDVISQDTDEESSYNGEYYKVKYPTYSVWNLTLSQYYGKNIKLKLGAKNLFDYKAPIATFNSHISPGRKFFVAIGYKF